MPDVLVQTVLSPELAEWLKKDANKQGLSVAAWLRRMVMQQQQASRVRAWLHPATDPKDILNHRHSTATFVLERRASHPDGSIEFWMWDPNGKPFTQAALDDYNFLPRRQQIATGWIRLDGSMAPWTIVHTMADANAEGQLLMTLRPERHQ